MDFRVLACSVSLVGALCAAQPGLLRAGAARLDITPAQDAALQMSGYAGRTEGHKGIHDNLYVRALVLDDGAAQVAMVTCDLIGFPHALWEKTVGRVSRETGIAVTHVLLAGTHTHGAPTPPRSGGSDKQAAYIDRVEAAVVEAVRQAKAALEPARVGSGAGRASVAVNRRARMADGRWWLGQNPDGPTDRTLAVVKFETPAGKPIALLVNYGVHGVVMGPRNYEITADLPGATSRFIEGHYGDQVVGIFTSGAAGDQNPIYGPGTEFSQVAALGQILGEEALRVAGEIRTWPRARLRAAQRVVSCPGQKLAQGARPRTEYVFEDADPVDIRLSLVMVGDIAVTGVSGEVLTMIGQRLKRESPYTATMMVTNASGSSGYLPDDASYTLVSYEIVTARVKRGCAEASIVNGLLE
ncbi:MAG: hypothetical protein FJW34_27335, partial [Acidobacteria bacterium]|nr:hypothetical protein [Acidobacteriota bacterium]